MHGKFFVDGRDVEVGGPNLFELSLSFLVLHFYKKEETEICLQSIREFTKIKNYEIVVLSNGGEQDYLFDFYKRGLIDRLFLYNKNYGNGIGVHDLFNVAKGTYCIHAENDQRMVRELDVNEFIQLTSLLNMGYSSVDLAGGAGERNKYSQRPHIIKTETFKQLPIKGYGGPGPLNHCLWSEHGSQLSFKYLDYKIYHNHQLLFVDNGYRIFRTGDDGKVTETQVR